MSESVNTKRIPHPLHLLEISSLDYWLFRQMQYALADQRFISFGDSENSVLTWNTSKDETFFRDGI